MKVFMINSVCGIRSTGRICTDLAQQLKAAGHDCRIAYGRESVPEQYESFAVRVGSKPGIQLHALQARIFDNAGMASKAATRKLVARIRDYDPDIVHLHNIHGYYLDVELLFDCLKKLKKPVIWTLHDCWSFTGHCAHFGMAGCDRWKTGCHHCPKKGSYPASMVLDRSRANYARKKAAFTGVEDLTLVAPCHWLGDLTRESFLKDYPVAVIYNGIDLSVFTPTESDFRARYGLENRKIVMGAASAWDDSKGLSDMVRLAGELGEDYAVVIVGVTEKQKQLLPDTVIAITRTESPRELAEIYTAADVFANPTYEDNYPTVNLEAQACGTPVITYRTGGSVESVPEDCVVPQGDIAALAQKIREGGYACRTDLDFGREAMLEAYMDLYRKGIRTT